MNLNHKSRNLKIDLLKCFSCLIIVAHHLSIYGPMSQVVYPSAPYIMHVLSHYGKLAVQVFLVIAGFLAASSLAPKGLCAGLESPHVLRLIVKRYLRLAPTLLLALSVLLVILALGHQALPDLKSLLAHALFLQDILHIPALSAGVWYVAIDFQLYSLSVLLFYFIVRVQKLLPYNTDVLPLMMVSLLCALSLCIWNLNEDLDIWGIYFLGSYGLGMLAHTLYLTQSRRVRVFGQLGLVLLVLLALIFAPRIRIFIALIIALLLVQRGFSSQHSLSSWRQQWRNVYCHISDWSYAIFVLHYAMIMLMSMIVDYFAVTNVFFNICALYFTFFLSIVMGALLYQCLSMRFFSFKKRGS